MSNPKAFGCWVILYRGAGLLQSLQDGFDPRIAFRDLLLVEIVQVQGLSQGEDVLFPVVADQGLANRLDRGVAPAVPIRGQGVRVALARHECPDDAHPGRPGDVRDDVVDLQVHLGQRLLHVLDVRGRVIQQALALPQVRPQLGDLALRPEAAPEQPILVQALQPFGVADVALAPRDVPGVAGVGQHDLEPALLEDLVGRDPVDPGRLHGDGLDPARLEPVGEPVQLAGDGAEGPHRLRVTLRIDGRHMHRGTDIDGRRVGMDGGQTMPATGTLGLSHGTHS
jgi:hypothetical protein